MTPPHSAPAERHVMRVERVSLSDARPWMLEKHYAKLVPAIVTDCFGLFDGRILVGVCAYGPPTCRMYNKGFAAFGEPLAAHSFELLRLVVDCARKNASSFLVGGSLSKLASPAFVVSYADAKVGHVGYIYQATNWIYTGMSKARRVFTDTRTGEILHDRTIGHQYGMHDPKKLPQWIEVSTEPKGKHRYMIFLGDRRERRAMKAKFKYKALPYPKGDTKRHGAGGDVQVQVNIFGGENDPTT